MEHHHHVEETVFFPALQKVDGIPEGLLDAPLNQHVVIHEGLIKLLNYATSTSKQPAEYRWNTMKGIIDSFAPDLNKHLNEEIDILLKFESYNSEAIWKCFQATEKAATADANLDLLHNVFPAILGASDKTYEGGNSW